MTLLKKGKIVLIVSPKNVDQFIVVIALGRHRLLLNLVLDVWKPIGYDQRRRGIIERPVQWTQIHTKMILSRAQSATNDYILTSDDPYPFVANSRDRSKWAERKSSSASHSLRPIGDALFDTPHKYVFFRSGQGLAFETLGRIGWVRWTI